jgi:hypothetical protein
MMTDQPAPAAPATPAPWWRWLFPMPRLALLVALLLVAGEEFPLTRLPMYATFDPAADYFYVADASGRPLACAVAFGLSTATVKKMFRSRLGEITAARGADRDAATPDERRRAGETLLAELRETGARRGAAVPAGPVRLLRVEVRRAAGAPDGFARTEELIAEQ